MFQEAVRDVIRARMLERQVSEKRLAAWACRWGREDLVRLLLDRDADSVEKEAEPWATPLAWAGQKGHSAIVALIQERRHD